MYHLIGESLAAFIFLVLIVLLVIEIRALRRYRHRCFLWLAIGTSLNLLTVLIGAGMYFVDPKLPAMLLAYEVHAFFYVPAALISLWGTVLLFRSYGELFDIRQPPLKLAERH